MSKKQIIIMAAAGLVSFAGAFIVTWLTGSKTPANSQAAEPNQSSAAVQQSEPNLPLPPAGLNSGTEAIENEKKRVMTEKQLRYLIYDVREKIADYSQKLKDLEQNEQRLQITQQVLKKDVNELNNLRVELATTVARLKEERDKLLDSRLRISQEEEKNLTSIAATYDKMDSASAGKILANMCGAQDGKVSGTINNIDDAVKILRYMTERTKAKVLAEIAGTEPKLAAILSQRLKQIYEKKE
jgi:flagellar motility protein MotE (MotC chaperone)